MLETVRHRVGEEFLIELRLCADDFLDNGIRIADAVQFAQAAEAYVDLIQVTAGSDTSNRTVCQLKPTIFMPHLCHMDLSAAIRREVRVPVVMNGGVMTPEEGETVIASGSADGVSMCRALIADPDLVNKARMGRSDQIRPCIRCLRCLGDMQRTKEFRCSVNPYCGREYRMTRQMAMPSDKRIAVIGGGVSGMMAALSAAGRGCHVTLFEKERLGGTLNYVERIAHRADVRQFVDYLIRRIHAEPRINLLLGITATPELIAVQQPDAVIAAIGGKPSIPQEVQSRMNHVMDNSQVYHEDLGSNQTIVVIGGGEAGCEAALFLGRQGHHVTLLERKPMILPMEQAMLRGAWEEQLEAANVEILTGIHCLRLSADQVIAMDLKEQTHVEFPADRVVFAIGGKRAIQEAELFRNCAPMFAAAGSCVHTSDLKRAVFDGFCAGAYL